VKFGAFASLGFRCKSLIISFSLRDIVSIIHYDVTICMKLDPGIHIVKHLVFFGKLGVTPRRFVLSSQGKTLTPRRLIRNKWSDDDIISGVADRVTRTCGEWYA
jgi:hypothetical protein